MRTRVALPVVAAQSKAILRRRNLSFRAAFNHPARAWQIAQHGNSRPYRVPSRRMGLRPGADLSHALQTSDGLEDEEIVRKLQLRK